MDEPTQTDEERLIELGKDIWMHMDLDNDQLSGMENFSEKDFSEVRKMMCRMAETVCEWLPLYIKITDAGLPLSGETAAETAIIYGTFRTINRALDPLVSLAAKQTRASLEAMKDQ